MKKSTRKATWLPNVAPQNVLIGCAFFVIFCIGGAVVLTIYQPSLGVTWTTPSSHYGLIINNIHNDIQILRPGDRIVTFGKQGDKPIMLRNEMIVVDPDLYAGYEDYNRFFSYQRALMEVLKQPFVELSKQNRRKVILIPYDRRNLSELPLTFWVHTVSGAVCLIIGVGVWSYRRGEPSSRLLATAGFGFFIGMVCLSVYASREIAMDAELFRTLANTNHFFMCLFPYSLLLLFWYYPIRLGNIFVVCATYFIMILFWLNITLQWIEFPFHAFYVPTFVIPYGVALPLSVIQWKKTVKLPVERAALKWFLLSILISLGITTPLLLLPALHEISLEFPLWAATLMVLIMFSGLALGVLRYNLFQLERWWYLGWLWFGSYMLIFAIDILLIRTLQISPRGAIVFAILVVLWIYFPLRRWLWNRWINPPEYLLQTHLPKLIDLLFSSSSSRFLQHQWGNLLQQIFSPLSIRLHNNRQDSISVSKNGQVMKVPTVGGNNIYELSYNKKGTKLFGHQDQKLAQFIFTIARESIRLKQAHEQSTMAERNRIMRDLHDDVSGKLLHLIHNADSEHQAQLARSALKSLRETIYISIYGSEKPLDEILADWRAELNERLERGRPQLIWNQPTESKKIYLTPRQHINCGRILNEAVSNILNHTEASKIFIFFNVKETRDSDHEFFVLVRDNGKDSDMSAWVEGVGLNNMRTRAAELNGTIRWIRNSAKSTTVSTGITVEFHFPLRKIPLDPSATPTNGDDDLQDGT